MQSCDFFIITIAVMASAVLLKVFMLQVVAVTLFKSAGLYIYSAIA